MTVSIGAGDATRPNPSAVDVSLCAGRNLRRLWRSPFTVVQSVLFPSLLLVVLVVAFGRVVGGTIEAYAQRIVPQVVIAGSAFGAAGTGMAVLADRTNGMVDRLRSLPIARSSFLVGTVAADAARTTLAALLLVLVGHVPGFRFDQGAAAAVGFVLLVVAFGSAWTWMAVLLGLVARSSEAIGSVMNGPVLILFFLSVGFVPVDGFPGPVQPLVRINPMSCAVNALMGLSGGGPILVPVLQTLAWTVALVVLFGTVAIRRARRSA